ncbi:hypothetical protein SAMN05216168_0266 [Kosakonia radicincitans]|nr:hypothetical protein SAMN05216168_0266 [Kosakonia radicincitans]
MNMTTADLQYDSYTWGVSRCICMFKLSDAPLTSYKNSHLSTSTAIEHYKRITEFFFLPYSQKIMLPPHFLLDY